MQYADVVEPPADPEAMQRRQRDMAELRQLEARERAVKERAKRVFLSVADKP